MVRQLTDLIFPCYQRDIPAWILKAVLNPPAEAHSGPSQTSQMQLFASIVNAFKLKFLFFKIFHCRYLQGPVTPLICSNAGN